MTKMTQLQLAHDSIMNTINVCRDYNIQYEQYGFLYDLKNKIHSKIMRELENDEPNNEIDDEEMTDRTTIEIIDGHKVKKISLREAKQTMIKWIKESYRYDYNYDTYMDLIIAYAKTLDNAMLSHRTDHLYVDGKGILCYLDRKGKLKWRD